MPGTSNRLLNCKLSDEIVNPMPSVDANDIAYSAQGLNQRLIKPAIDLVPQSIDVNVDNVCHSVVVKIPDVLQDHGAD